MSYRYVFLLGIIWSCTIKNQAARLGNALSNNNDNTCYFEHYGKPLSEAEWIEGINISSSILDVEPSFTKLYTARSRNIRGIDGIKINGRYVKDNYVDILLVRDNHQNNLEFIIALGVGFKNYEEYETSDIMKINVTFLCESGYLKSLEIRQKIIDTNNHDPYLNPSDYNFYLPQNLGANHFIGLITARDIDLTNNYISFNFRSTGNNTEKEFALLGVYQDEIDPKSFHAWFVTTTNVSLYDNKTINIYAQDSGRPSRTANAQVRLSPVAPATTIIAPPEEEITTPPPAPEGETSPPPGEENPAPPQE